MSLSALEVPQALIWKREVPPEPHAPSKTLSGWLDASRPFGDRGHGAKSDPPPMDDSYSGNASDPIRITHAVLAICLNLSTPQNQRVKTEEAFFDPATRHHERAMRKIISNLVSQLDAVQRLAILALPDPRQETVLEAIHKARREARDEYLLFLYNNHGTLPPTEQGELWVYDQDFPTQPSTYNPVFMSHILDAAKPGAIFVLDSDNSGRLIDSALEYGRAKDAEVADRAGRSGHGHAGGRAFTEANIYFGASSHHQVLPIAEGLPRDAFTACLLSPLLMALRFSWLNDSLRISANLKDASPKVTKEDLLSIPGEVDDRDTPLGELNWLLSAIIETIAWQFHAGRLVSQAVPKRSGFEWIIKGVLPSVATAYRSQRVLRTYDCIPVSYPPIPSAHLNPLWQVWDLALDDFLSQLPIQRAAVGTSYVYRSPIMLPELLQAFGAQVRMGAAALTPESTEEEKRVVSEKTKLDLPFAIHALLGNRLRDAALSHLTRYLDIGGKWPVYWAFQCGLDLLQPRLLDWHSEEDKNKVIYIFSRLITHPCGPAMLSEERRANGQLMISVFVDLLREPAEGPEDSDVGHVAAERIASILFMMWKAIDHGIVDGALVRREGWAALAAGHMLDRDALVRQWAIVVWTNVWFLDSEVSPKEHLENVIDLLSDEAVEVRGTAVYTMHIFASRRLRVSGPDAGYEEGTLPRAPIHPEFIAEGAKRVRNEATHLIRNMMVWVIDALFREHGGWFEVAVWRYVARRELRTPEVTLGLSRDRLSVQKALDAWIEADAVDKPQKKSALDCFTDTFNALLLLSVDPDTSVERNACGVLDMITRRAIDSKLGTVLGHLKGSMSGESFSQKIELTDGEADIRVQFAGLALTSLDQNPDNVAEVTAIIATLTSTASSETPETRSRSNTTASQNGPVFPSATSNIDWPDRLAQYFDTPRLVWTDTPSNGQATVLERHLRFAEDQGMKCESQADKAWTRHITEIPLERNPRLLRFHAFSSTLAVIMDNVLELWDTDSQKREQSITLSVGKRFRQANFFNEESEPDSLITLSDHGIVRAYRRSLIPEIAASAVFRVIEDYSAVPLTRLFSAWNQGRGELFLAGNTGDISIWSSQREQCVRRMATGTDSRATAIDTEEDRGNMSIVGYHNGRVSMYDQRQHHKVCVRSYDVHRGRVLAVGMNVGASAQELVSTSVDGVMNVWDIRVAHQPITGTSLQRGLPTPPSAGSAIHKASGVTAMFTHSAVQGALDLCIHRLAFPKPSRTTTAVLPWTLPAVTKEEFQRLVFADFHPTRMQLAVSTGPSVVIRGVEP